MSDSSALAIEEVYDHVKKANYAAAFNLLMEKLELSPEKKATIEELLSFVLHQHTDQLQSEEKYAELFDCYDKVLLQYPKDCELLTELGSRLYKLGRYVESFSCFQQVLQIDPKHLKAFHSLQYVKDKLVERWHFRMLNDCLRNCIYASVIASKVELGCDSVLDIGTGTGLLALYAFRGRAKTIMACETSDVMVSIAQKVFAANGMRDVEVMGKNSRELTENDLPHGRPKLIVTEILDCGVFGEEILETLMHAKEHLLAEGGEIFPQEVTLIVAPFQSRSVAMGSVLLNESFEDYIFLNGYSIVAPQTDLYDTISVSQLASFETLCSPVECLKVNFNDLQQMRESFNGASNTVKMRCAQSGYVDGFVVWFKLAINSHGSAVIESSPTSESCWDQAIFRLNQRLYVEAGRMLTVTVSCSGGHLRLRHAHNQPMEKCLEIPEDVLRFINDTDYLTKLEYDVNSQRKDGSFPIVMDFSPFPYLGMMLLKEKRARKLYCSSQARSFIAFVAENNCIDAGSIEYLSSPLDPCVANAKATFDLIILAPVQQCGDLNNTHVAMYPLLRTMLQPKGLIVPDRIEVVGNIIRSDWLVKSSMVVNPEMDTFGISPHINQYATQHFLDLSGNFEHVKLTTLKIADLALDDALHETSVSFRATKGQKIDGILYHFNIFFTRRSDPLVTHRADARNCCFLSRGECDSKAQLTIHFVQNFGLIKCSIVEFD
ncbi:protein arginine N-methyltransferase 9-like [Phlebotomus argentipes]|uniref:protein arginine N-methyltransferase 9-like n=1 Tax=Phlebotomus argentipes TaxID=94469 RepID=UPI0028932013|nr:protein arginine N-methyltransferase 9-like [Phlebotomus argentipes]